MNKETSILEEISRKYNKSLQEEKLILQQELKNLENMLQRKRDYYYKANKQIIKDAIKSEINIIQKYRDAVGQEIEEIKYLYSQKRIDNLFKTIETLELVCILHGIFDYKVFVMMGKDYLLHQVKEAQKDGYVIVPHKIKKHLNLPDNE